MPFYNWADDLGNLIDDDLGNYLIFDVPLGSGDEAETPGTTTSDIGSTIRCDPTTPRPTHDVSLQDRDGLKLGLLLCDANGVHMPSWSRTPIERTALKTTSGNSQYSDLDYPYSPIVQDDWSGGRGGLDFESDRTKFFDSYRMRTSRQGKAFLGPQEQYSTGIRGHTESVPGDVTFISLTGSTRYLAKRFTPAASFTAAAAWLIARKRGTPGNLTIGLYADSGGALGAVMTEITVLNTRMPDTLSEWLDEAINRALTGGTYYWIMVYAAGTDTDDNHWEIGVKPEAGTTDISTAGASWSDAPVFDLYFRLTDADVSKSTILFSYQEQSYAMVSGATGAPKIYENGDRGAADSNAGALTKLNDATKSWTTDEWIGSVVRIISGPGSSEKYPYRTVTANSATQLTVDSAWGIEHTTATNYVILASNKWHEITGHDLTAPVTDLLVSPTGVLYVCMGDSITMHRLRQFNDGGTWKHFDDVDCSADESATTKASYIALMPQANRIGIACNSDVYGKVSVSLMANSRIPEWGTDLIWNRDLGVVTITIADPGVVTLAYHGLAAGDRVVFRTTDTLPTGITAGTVYYVVSDGMAYNEFRISATPDGANIVTSGAQAGEHTVMKYLNRSVGSANVPIKSLMVYPDEGGNEAIWAFKLDRPWLIPESGANPYPITLAEMAAIKSFDNFTSSLVHNVYLYFPLGAGLERYYAKQLDDIGPNIGEGLPTDRRGVILGLVGYPGKFFASIDGGTTGYSSLMMRDGSGWHEHYRAPLGQRITALMFEPTPGTALDRLWMCVGNDLIWLPFPSNTTNELHDSNYLYTHEGSLELSRMHAGMFDVQKLAKTIKLWSKNMLAAQCWIELDYKLADDDEYTAFEDPLVLSPISEIDLTSIYGIASQQYQLRLRFYTADAHLTPILNAIIVEAVMRISVKFVRPLTFVVRDEQRCLDNSRDEILDAMLKLNQLDTWAGDQSDGMLLMRARSRLYDGKLVFLNPIAITQTHMRNPRKPETRDIYVCSTSVQDA